MKLRDHYPLFLGGTPIVTSLALDVRDKFSGDIATRVSQADAEVVEQAIQQAVTAASALRKMPPFERQKILYRCLTGFESRAEEFAQALCIEAGKTIRDSRGEVSRLIDTFRIAADESVRAHGEMLNPQISARALNYRGMVQRVPVGPCSFISPFNFPLNLVAHKVAPAIAAGCPFVLKPASRTPVGALLIGEVLADSGLPAGAFSILPCSRDAAEPLTTDDRFRLLSFTGSADAGWSLKAKAGKKKVVLELGGNAACIVEQDAVAQDNDLRDVTSRLIFGAFYQSGQSCISVQRILIHASVYERLRSCLVAAAEQLVMGDPGDEKTDIGPLIDESEAVRIEKWVQSAMQKGAHVLCGGVREGRFYQPTLLENVAETENVWCEEVFGPVAVLRPFESFSEALQIVNDSRYGLQAGLFTRDIDRIHQAWDTLDVGGVIAGDVPSWRVDNMPYGGVKDSGIGREGVRYAMEEMTEARTLIIRSR